MISYKEAIEYIYDLNKYGIKLGLNNITYLLSLFGNPHLKTKVIHVAGTNGKGSTAVILSSILKSAGFRVGLYTSPHLVHFQERMRINGEFISQEDICRLLEKIKPVVQQVAKTEGYQHPTFFEVITAMAFQYFFENHVDFAIMEVGLGGRLDATNVTQPLASIITHIDYDHMDRLGNTLTEIAGEKGAIIKKNTPVVNAKQFTEAHKVIKMITKAKNAPLYSLGEEIKTDLIHSNLKGNRFNYSGIFQKIANLNISLVGKYQVENSSLAIAVTELLNHMGYLVKENNIVDALDNIKWPGRFEIIQEKPMIVLDGAHNPNGVAQFTINLKKLLPSKQIIAILGIFSDKDYPGIIKKIVPFVDKVIFTMANNPRATPTKILAREAVKYINPEKIMEKPTVDSAIQKSLQIAREDDLICVTGSLYTVGEAEAYFLKRKNGQ